MNKEKLEELIKYAESAKADGYPFEVNGEDLDVVLEALKAELNRTAPHEKP